MFEGFGCDRSCFNIDQDVAWNCLEVDASHANDLLERVADCRVVLCAGGAGKHERDSFLHREGSIGKAAHQAGQKYIWGEVLFHLGTEKPGGVRLAPLGPAGIGQNNYCALAGNSQGTMGINDVVGLASGEAGNTAIAPRSAPVNE